VGFAILLAVGMQRGKKKFYHSVGTRLHSQELGHARAIQKLCYCCCCCSVCSEIT